MSNDRLRELLTKRSSIKGQITKFKKYLKLVADKKELSNIALVELNLKLSKFEALSIRFDDLQGEIEVLNADNIDSEIDEREDIESDIINSIASAKTLIDKYNQTETELRRSSIAHDTHCILDHQEVSFKLPQIQISKFDGAYFRWLEFRDTFENLIHTNNRIKPIHKFHYLLSYLEGDAARIVSNLEVSSANYTEAWRLLCERYDNKRLLINHHLSSLFNVHPISRESERSLRFLVDHVTKNLRALANLGQPTDKWDILIIFMLSSKLDSRTLMKWEEFRNTLPDVPTLDQFHKFLIDRADVLESLNRNKYENNSLKNISQNVRPAASAAHGNNNYSNKYERSAFTKSFACTSQAKQNVYSCVICNANHRIYDCNTFKAKSIKERLADVAKYKLCINCLRQGHPASECRMGPCKECKRRHNSLLHNPASESIQSTEVVCQSGQLAINKYQVILSTALIELCNQKTGAKLKVRALLDCGSQASFISQDLKHKLCLEPINIDTLKVIGIGNNCNNVVKESCILTIKSLNTKFTSHVSCFILNELTGRLPKMPIDINTLKLPKNIKLADPNFNQPTSIDMLIGADIFWEVLGNKELSLGVNNTKLRSSKLGWLIVGSIIPNVTNSIECNYSLTSKVSQDNIENMLTKFWELEELPTKNIISESEKICENHFLIHTTRLSTGRFCVKLPLIDTPDCLGDSYYLARKRFLNLEKKFHKNPDLKIAYTDFIREYTELGHLSESSVAKPNLSYFLCHHAVFKSNSESTKLRVVFDGSAPTSSGFSLNDILRVGPNIQDSLFSILLRARQYKYLLTGDIEKMYRQVQVNSEDANLQLILWRDNESEPIKTLRLNTLTYGTASASYLSTRCLKQIGEEQEDELIKTIIQKDMFVDDLVTGSNSECELRYIQKGVSEALLSGCFNLRKFRSNLKNLFENSNVNTMKNLTISESSNTLGLGWDPSSDCLHFPIKAIPECETITKRFIMSNSFKLFDPLGILSPCIIKPKILLQKLWQQKIDWDQPVSNELKQEWLSFIKTLNYLKNVQIPRRVICELPKYIEIHSFSDASLYAYGACIYVRSLDANNVVTIKLLCAKSKVSPLKPTTVPRLELAAAVLAARLCSSVVESLRLVPNKIIHWCDSTTVLAWINHDVKRLKSFVANRIIEINEKTRASSWRYVPTNVNPADLISRGVDFKQIVDLKLWWYGPSFLLKDEISWPVLKPNTCETLTEIKCNVVAACPEKIVNFEKFSRLNRLQRTYAYVLRFIFNLKNPKNKHTDNLSIDELNKSFYLLCITAQKEIYPIEYELLSKGKQLSTKSKLLSLSPFIDNDKLIRVGGRIELSDYPYEKRHPILLHASHHLTKLIFHREHLDSMHAGPQLLLATVREAVWPVNGRYLARRTVNNCVRCRRIRGRTMCPVMGNLPIERITPNFPFLSVGLDFAGPFNILNRKGRGSKLIKCYLCLFICMRFKCIHLEAVSDLSKDAFIMTLKRFISRRGKPEEVFCDNGRNFVATARELGDFLKVNNNSISDFANQKGIQFKFIPAYAPHFGGIWEAGVKSAKYHIRRVLGNSHLTFEEISTLFAQVEAILNSRPLCPLSASPNDFLSLSPGHFIIGRPLTALPLPALEDCNESRLRRYNRLEKIRQHFWQRWQREYISELQQRTKWRTNKAQIGVGDMVVLQEDYVPPLNWRLGRVSRLFPGSDGVPRVADVETTKGCVRRPLVRLCPLPSAEELKA